VQIGLKTTKLLTIEHCVPRRYSFCERWELFSAWVKRKI
jgi:hypothetical protein